jgi:hypothetical protein
LVCTAQLWLEQGHCREKVRRFAKGFTETLAQAKAAAKLEDVADDLRRLMGEGLRLSAMAARLNAEHIRTSRGRAETATAVNRASARL